MLQIIKEAFRNCSQHGQLTLDKFNQALTGGSVMEQAEMIADLVIDRELQKVETRKAYRKHKDEQQSKRLNGCDREL